MESCYSYCVFLLSVKDAVCVNGHNGTIHVNKVYRLYVIIWQYSCNCRRCYFQLSFTAGCEWTGMFQVVVSTIKGEVIDDLFLY